MFETGELGPTGVEDDAECYQDDRPLQYPEEEPLPGETAAQLRSERYGNAGSHDPEKPATTKPREDKKCINKEERVRYLPGYCP